MPNCIARVANLNGSIANSNERVAERTEQLRESEGLLRERADLLELATEAIMVRDMNGVMLYWNSGAEALYGWRREEVLGKPIHQVLKTSFPKGISAT